MKNRKSFVYWAIADAAEILAPIFFEVPLESGFVDDDEADYEDDFEDYEDDFEDEEEEEEKEEEEEEGKEEEAEGNVSSDSNVVASPTKKRSVFQEKLEQQEKVNAAKLSQRPNS